MHRHEVITRAASWLGWLLLWAAFLLGSGAAWGQAAAEAAPTERVADGVPVKVENRTLFTFRASFGAFTPQQRADAARERVRAIVGEGGPLVVTV